MSSSDKKTGTNQTFLKSGPNNTLNTNMQYSPQRMLFNLEANSIEHLVQNKNVKKYPGMWHWITNRQIHFKIN